ncbi:transcription factor bHLH19-like [Spinacia oleracea]|uniref:Transcription factor bHLH19-like n=1 Tax=Spinacia oleracea TaxID=3562 RepID=A0A9R0JVQ9_SPIOL|nr:transcription factor bHLH19-like [Spinacia oleracea]
MLSFAKSSNNDSQNGEQVQIMGKESSDFSNYHILAERKRREKLNQRFIALTAIIPGLKKMDKASILEEAINYVKQLEEQVKTLEEQNKTKIIESVVFVKRSRVSEQEEDELDHFSSNGALPEVEAIFYNKDVLIKIHCEKKNGVVEKLISYIENIHLVVINTSALGFGCASLHATIVAQMDVEFSMTTKDLVTHLHAALKRLMG